MTKRTKGLMAKMTMVGLAGWMGLGVTAMGGGDDIWLGKQPWPARCFYQPGEEEKRLAVAELFGTCYDPFEDTVTQVAGVRRDDAPWKLTFVFQRAAGKEGRLTMQVQYNHDSPFPYLEANGFKVLADAKVSSWKWEKRTTVTHFKVTPVKGVKQTAYCDSLIGEVNRELVSLIGKSTNTSIRFDGSPLMRDLHFNRVEIEKIRTFERVHLGPQSVPLKGK